MRIEINYDQIFGDELLTDSYTKTISNISEAEAAIAGLYSDPHVVSASWHEVTGK